MPMTFFALLLGTVSTGVHQVEAIMIKKYNGKYGDGGYIFTALISFFAMIFFFIKDTDGLSFPPILILYGVLSGVMFCMASYFTVVALGCGSFVLTKLFLSYTLVFSLVYSLFFLKEEIKIFSYFGLLLMFVSSIMFRSNKKSEDDKKVKITFKWVISTLLSVVGAGMFGVMRKLQQVELGGAYDNEFMIVNYAVTVITLLAIGIIKDGKNSFTIFCHGIPYALVAGLSNGLTNFLGLVINLLIPLSVGTGMGAANTIVISYLIARFVFKEKLSVRQNIAVVIGAASIVLFNL